MNKDIRLLVGFPDHPKTVKLVRRLGSEVIRPLLRLWLWVAQNRPRGALTGMDTDDVAIAAGWEADPTTFVAVLEEIGFLDRDGDGWQIHDWHVYQYWAVGAPERSEAARHAAKARWGKHGADPANDDPEPGECE